MEWNRAKDIIIVFLVLLNIMLGVLTGINNRKYSLSAEREKIIVDLLATNNISIYCKITNDYKPMKILELEVDDMDEAKMVEAFLGSSYAVMSQEDQGIKRYDYGGKSIIIYENKVIFEDGNMGEQSDYDSDRAKKLCDEYITGLGDMGKGYEIDIGPYLRGDEIILEYRQKINESVIYGNYIMFAVDSYGIRRIEYSAGKPVGYSLVAKEICPPDEALFTFLKAMKRESADKPQRIIEKMDIVYFTDYLEQETSQATPYYRIYYTEAEDYDRLLRLCVVNAYLSTWRFI